MITTNYSGFTVSPGIPNWNDMTEITQSVALEVYTYLNSDPNFSYTNYLELKNRGIGNNSYSWSSEQWSSWHLKALIGANKKKEEEQRLLEKEKENGCCTLL